VTRAPVYFQRRSPYPLLRRRVRDAAAIVVAGGQGKRFGGKVRKQFLSLSGRPLLWWAVRAFDRSPSIGDILLVLPKEDLERTRRASAQWRVKKPLHWVAGGRTRADSVRQGLAGVPPGYRWVAVHDAVRPLVTPSLIEEILQHARRHRAAIAAAPSRDTVKLAGRDQTIRQTLPRDTVWLAQTPQVFERRLLEKAHQAGRRLEATDDAFLVEQLGVRVKLVASPADNLKVTVPADLKRADRLLRERS
jgi:2-C-methyl-D-erythritol 4-phosphate cytidylyltransferase